MCSSDTSAFVINALFAPGVLRGGRGGSSAPAVRPPELPLPWQGEVGGACPVAQGLPSEEGGFKQERVATEKPNPDLLAWAFGTRSAVGRRISTACARVGAVL